MNTRTETKPKIGATTSASKRAPPRMHTPKTNSKVCVSTLNRIVSKYMRVYITDPQ